MSIVISRMVCGMVECKETELIQDIGRCGFNGDGCTLVELTLINPDPARPGSGSSADISLIPP